VVIRFGPALHYVSLFDDPIWPMNVPALRISGLMNWITVSAVPCWLLE